MAEDGIEQQNVEDQVEVEECIEPEHSPWSKRLLWIAIAAVVGTVLSFVSAVLLGKIQHESPKLYYIVGSRRCYQFSSVLSIPVFGSFDILPRNTWIGTVELGNDGNGPMENWSASISFKGATVMACGATMGERSLEIKGQGTPTMTVKYTDSPDVLNQGDKVIVHYMLDNDAKPTVYFKGKGSSGEPRNPQAAGVSIIWLYLVGAVAIGAILVWWLCLHLARIRRRTDFKDVCFHVGKAGRKLHALESAVGDGLTAGNLGLMKETRDLLSKATTELKSLR